MNNRNITKSMKREITYFWNEKFPEMGIYKPMMLMNVLGPFSVGLCLDIQSERDRYYPILFLQNLARESDDITFGVAIQKEDIRPTASKEKKVNKIIFELQENTVIPTSGKVVFSDMINNLKAYSEQVYGGILCSTVRTLMYLAGWSGKQDVLKDIIDFGKYVIKKDNILGTDDEIDYWIAELFEKTKDMEKLRQTVFEMEKKFGFEKLPHRELIM